MAKFVLAIFALLALVMSNLTADALNELKNVDFDSCGLFCEPSLDTPPAFGRAPHRHRPRRLVHAHPRRVPAFDKQQAGDEQASPKALPKDTLNALPLANKPVDPRVRADVELKVAPAGLESLADLARRLTAESRRAAISSRTAVTDDPRVALLITKVAVTTISELAGKSVAVESNLSESDAAIRVALVAAGAPEIQISEDRTDPLNRVLRGEVPGAIIGLVLRERVSDLPEVEGYRVFQVPLSPS